MMQNNIYNCLVFPHPIISDRSLKRLLAVFHEVHLTTPWYLEPPKTLDEDPRRRQIIKTFRPPEDLKPPPDFRNILEECKTWIQTNPRGGYGSFLKAVLYSRQEDETKWEIRQSIRALNKKSDHPKEDINLQNHLIIHLYSFLDTTRQTTEEALGSIKASPSPLKDALGEEIPSFSIMDDFDTEFETGQMDEQGIKEVLEAWLNLFSSYIRDYSFLVTFEENIENFIVDIFEEASTKDILSAAELPSLTAKILDFSSYSYQELIEILEHIKEAKDQFLNCLINDFPNQVELCKSSAKELYEKVRSALAPVGLPESHGFIEFKIKKLPLISREKLRETSDLSLLSNKYLVLVK